MQNKKSENYLRGHIFKTTESTFYYDYSSQELVEIDSVMACVLPVFDQCKSGAIPGNVLTRHGLSSIQDAVASIERGRLEDGLFLTSSPKLVPGKTPVIDSSEYASELQHLVLTLTDRCNLRCGYCMHGADLDWVRSHGQQNMSLEMALKATDFFLERCTTSEIPAVSFYGGESLLQIEVIEAVVKKVRNHPKGKKAHLIIDTNGVLLGDQVIDLIVDNTMHLQVSLDGPQPIHDRQRSDAGGQGTFHRIMAAIDELLKRDLSAHKRLSFICTVAPPVDLMELDSFFGEFPLYAAHGLAMPPNLQVNPVNLKGQKWPASDAEFKDLGRQYAQLREVYYQAVSTGKRESLGPVVKSLVESSLFRLHHRSRAPMAETYTPGGNCQPGIRKLHVTADGEFQPCERTGSLLQIGHIESGVKVGAVQDLQDGFFAAVKSNCESCWALRLCRICYAAWSEEGAAGAKVPESLCNSVRLGIEDDLKLLVRILDLPASQRKYLDDVEIV